jgi:CheY-like chemotaxis protein
LVEGITFDFLLLDARMPGIDGFEVADRIRRDSGFAQMTMMMVTSDDVQFAASRCRDLGIGRYLVKPLKQLDLRAAMVEALSRRSVAPAVSVPAAVPSGPAPRILLAEDNPINQRLAQALLEKRGWRVTAVRTGRAALEALERDDFDLVLMDVQMPDLDGMEATRLLRQQEEDGRRLPVIGLTAHVMAGDRERCLEAGMDDHVPKPIRPDVLYAAVERCLVLRRPGETLPPPVDFTDALQALRGDREFIMDLAGQFVRDFPWQLEQMQRAVGESDSRTVERLAHSLKSVAGIFGARAAVEIAKELESFAGRRNLAPVPDLLRRLQTEVERVKSFLAL